MTRRQSLWALILMTIFLVSTLGVGEADARRKRRKKRGSKKAKVTQKANVKALRELMGAFKFGMTPDEVVKVVNKQIKERYAEQISQTNDVYEQDKLRRLQEREIKRLQQSKVKFDGRKSGWDVSLIDDQFVHGTDESMMVQWEIHEGKNQRRFFFFHDGELYKMFIQLDTAKFNEDQKSFEFFRSLMEKRFGQGIATDVGLSWKLRDIHVDALDKLRFYSSFCLVMTHPKRAALVAQVREDKKVKQPKYNTVTRSVLEDVDDGGPSLDEGSGKVDRILGDL